MKNLINFVIVIFCVLGVILCQDHFNFDGGYRFCLYAPSNAQLEEYETHCEHCTVFWRPLQNVRDCCDIPPGTERVQCLENLRIKELEVVELFLDWKEPEARNELYRQHLEKCGDVYDVAFRDISCAGNKMEGEFCLDPIGEYKLNCAKNLTECREFFPRRVKKDAFDAICVNDLTDLPDMRDNPTEVFTSVHIRCWKQQALTKLYMSVINIATYFNMDCLDGRYGLDIDQDSYDFKKTCDDWGFSAMWSSLSPSYEGIFDDIDSNAETYLDSVCDFESEYDGAKECIETPITETYITYESKSTFDTGIRQCCKGINGAPKTQNDRERLRQCLQDKHMYEQFYPFGGLYMRGLMRQTFGVMLECQSKEMMEEGSPRSFDVDVSFEEKSSNYTHYGYPEEIEEMLKLTATMTPENYHFFLRGYANYSQDSSNGFFKAACSACVIGEGLASQAYVFPGVMCPALVSNELYKPIQYKSECPDKLFYQFQVATYCCLYKAFEMYNLGEDYDPNVCPDITDVMMKYV